MNRATTVDKPKQVQTRRPKALQKASESSPLVAKWRHRYEKVRRFTEKICEPLEIEDYVVQSMPDASPVRWHLAHTTWFFETFLLREQSWYHPWNKEYEQLFNSYYNGVGKPFPRPQRGLLTRPTVKEVYEYRRHVDEAIGRWFSQFDGDVQDNPSETALPENQLLDVLEIGLHHEQQHQELILTDLKHALSLNPLYPVLDDWQIADQKVENWHGLHDRTAVNLLARDVVKQDSAWITFDAGIYSVGHGGSSFAYDNELPRHDVLEESFDLGRDLVTNGQWIEFMEAGGYRHPKPWLSMGWDWVNREEITSPLYWRRIDDQWHHFTYAGLQPVDPDGVVTHISYFEADAFARWAGVRLPTESQWEIAAKNSPVTGPFADRLLDFGCAVHPTTADIPDTSPDETVSSQEHDGVTRQASSSRSERGLHNLYGTVWQWTSSPYTPYPGYQAPPGTLGEYNGKFMCNQYVLRGGSCATPSGHLRPTYRNFFPPECRWQFTGLRLAK